MVGMLSTCVCFGDDSVSLTAGNIEMKQEVRSCCILDTFDEWVCFALQDGDSRLIAGEMEMKTGDVVVCAANVLLSFSLLAGAGDTLVFVSCCHPCFES